MLVGGPLFAQLRELSDEDPSLGDEIEIGLPVGVVEEDAHLTASDVALGDRFGVSVALSGDTAVVGAYLDVVEGHVEAGSAYVFGDLCDASPVPAVSRSGLAGMVLLLLTLSTAILLRRRSCRPMFLDHPRGTA